MPVENWLEASVDNVSGNAEEKINPGVCADVVECFYIQKGRRVQYDDKQYRHCPQIFNFDIDAGTRFIGSR